MDESDFVLKKEIVLYLFFFFLLSPLNQLLRGRLFPEQEEVWKER